MKLVLAVVTMLIAMPSFAGEVLSTRLFSTDARSEALPADLNFKADKIHVSSPTWYSSLFDEPGCESALSQLDLNTPIEIKTTGPNSLSLSLNGHTSGLISSATSQYIPIYYQMSQPVHPHFLIKLKGWVLLHAVIHKAGSKKTLKLSLVQGRGDDIHLVPILEATGQ